MKSIMRDITESNTARVNPQVTTFVFGFEGYFRKSTRSLRVVLEELNRSGETRKEEKGHGYWVFLRCGGRKMTVLMCSDIFCLIDFDLIIDIIN